MNKRSVARDMYLIFLSDLLGILATKDPKKIRERALIVTKGVTTILEALAPKSARHRKEFLKELKVLLDLSPCEDYQMLLRRSLRRLQGEDDE